MRKYQPIEKPEFNKAIFYIELHSSVNQYGEHSFMLWWWGNSINTNFIDTWMGQAYKANVDKNVKRLLSEGKKVQIINCEKFGYIK